MNQQEPQYWNGKEVAFYPNPGKQTEFLESPEYEVLYGGAAGGGKSHALLMAATQYKNRPSMQAVLVRREYPQLLQLLAKAKELYPKIGGRWIAGERRFVFPAGGNVWFRQAKTIDDCAKYQGAEYTFVGFDELTHWPTDEVYRFFISRLRSPDSQIRLKIRATTNPGSKGHCLPYGDVLTKEGWKHIRDVEVGEYVLSQSRAGEVSYKKVRQKHEYDGGEVSVYDTGYMHIACTPRHKIPIVTETKNGIRESVSSLQVQGRARSSRRDQATQGRSVDREAFRILPPTEVL